ncbi:MAG: Fur family transcriptional regulator [Pseudomonadota bacterium]
MKVKKKELYGKFTQFEDACRKAGLKLTQQRIELFRELVLASDHPSVETLHKRMLERLPTISLDTVYRTLATFEKHSLVKRVQTAESQARFELNVEEAKHHHLICRICGQITDFQWVLFDEVAPPAEIGGWGLVESKNATLYGICEKCSGKNE